MRISLTAAFLASTMSVALAVAVPVAQLYGQQTNAPAEATAAPSKMQKPPANAPYRNAALPVDERVADLLSRMTLEEKVGQIITLWDSKAQVQEADGRWSIAKANQVFPNGLGQLARPSDRTGPASPRVNKQRSIKESVDYVNAVQTWAVKETRLGIPVLMHEESLHGLAARDATSFPQSIAMASTWDPDLVRQVNSVIAREVRSRGVHLVLSPVVDIARDPRWGRIEETFGEDPYLVSEMGVAAVLGLQGEGKNVPLPNGKVFATLKHMTGHGQPESGTNVGPAPFAERTLREDFFPPFEAVVSRTGIQAVMASYNEIDGVPSHVNYWLLNSVLRGEWNFGGAVVSDYYAIDDLARLHKTSADLPEAARHALAAGVDADLPDGAAYKTLTESVRAGLVDEAAIDAAAARMLKIKFLAGLFENPYGNIKDTAITNNAEAVALARTMAAKSLVLLKNDGVLPLAMPDGTGAKPTIAVIGPNANVARLGGYYGIPKNPISPLVGIKALVGDKANIVFSEGVKITLDDDWWADDVKLADPAENRKSIAAAVEAAKDADHIVLFIGDTEQTSREGWANNHLGDRSSLDIVGEQEELFDALKATGKPVVVVLVNGRPPSYPGIVAKADAILETWYGGEQQGHAIADALFGIVNPGGKMPVTVVRNVGQIPYYYNHKPTARRGYLFDDKAALFPFGFGLSYTKFSFGEPRLSASSISAGQSVTVTVDVANTGAHSGDEVVQVYVRDTVSSVTRPVKELKGFRRVTIAPGAKQSVTVTLPASAFQMWNGKMQRVIEPGDFEIMVGPNSAETQSVKLVVTK